MRIGISLTLILMYKFLTQETLWPWTWFATSRISTKISSNCNQLSILCQNSEWEKLGNGKFSTQETLIRTYKARKCFKLSLYFSWLFCCYCNFEQTKDFDKKDSATLLSAKEFSSTGEQSDLMLIFQLLSGRLSFAYNWFEKLNLKKTVVVSEPKREKSEKRFHDSN